VFFGVECYRRQASAVTKRLLPDGAKVRLAAEPATDRADDYGRLLRYVIRARDGLNIDVYLLRVGAAAPYFYGGRRGELRGSSRIGIEREWIDLGELTLVLVP
jgi:endonuclease YncB( thermonuclease family)